MMNREQKLYANAKALLETLEAEESSVEHQYIIDNGIQNSDGTMPELIYCIDDEVAFDKANAECSKIVEESGLWQKILAAREGLKTAEVQLIKYGLSIAPLHEREVLTKAARVDYTTRIKIIDLVMKLDTATVK